MVSVEPSTKPFGEATQDLLGDVFHSLYNTEFEPLPDKEAPRDRLINHALMKWMSNDQEFMQAREKTKGRLAHSLVSSKFMYEYLIQDESIRRALEAQEQEPPPPQGQGSGSGEGDGGEISESLAKALKGLKGLENNIIGSQIMSNGAKKAEEQADKVDQAIKSWGVDPGDINVNNVDDIMQIVDNNNSKMQEIADLAGRFESVAASALEKVRESYIGQIVDAKRTQDFNLMFGTELCYLMSPLVPEAIHAKYSTDYVQAGLLGVEVRSEGKEFGSLYMMVDGSGSMSGTMEVYAKAVAMGLARALARDTLNNREYILNTFGSGRGDRFFSVKSSEDWKAHFTWASLQQGGGTDFDWALRRSIKDIKSMPEGTDLVFITDGSCDVSPDVIKEWKKFKDETGTRLLYVDVSGYNNEKLNGIADMYMHVDIHSGNMDFIADNIAAKLAENMETSRLKRIDVESDT